MCFLVLIVAGCAPNYLRAVESMRGLQDRASAQCWADSARCPDAWACSRATVAAARALQRAQELHAMDARYLAGETIAPPPAGEMARAQREAAEAERTAIRTCAERGVR